MNGVTLEFGVKTRVKEVNPIVQSQKYHLTDEVDLYEVLPSIGLTAQESMIVIHDFNGSKIKMKELVLYINKQKREQIYNDYKGVSITPTRIDKLRHMVVVN